MKTALIFPLLLSQVTALPIPAPPSDAVTPYCGTESGWLQNIGQSPLPNTSPNLDLPSIGPQNTSFVLVNFQDAEKNQPWSMSSVNSLFQTVSKFFNESSNHQTYLVGDVKGWYTLPVKTNDGCDPAVNAMNDFRHGYNKIQEVDLSQISRVVFFFPSLTSCPWVGLGELGGSLTTSWINGNIDPKTVQHEIGHNFNLGHAKFYQCGGNNPIAQNCAEQEYGDPSDSMGNIYGGHYTAFHKERIGWLDHTNAPSIEVVSTNGTYFIEPYETFSENSKALKILKTNMADGSKEFYYVEFRQSIGFDNGLSGLSKSNLAKGVLIHQGNDQNYAKSFLLDMTPQTSTADDAALLPGRTFSDAGAENGGVAIKLLSADSTGAQVKVQFGTNFTGVSSGHSSRIDRYQLLTMVGLMIAAFSI